jgi:acyl-CoA reductase-like NAD-dependent aldehyde dehydrogenase
MTKMLKSLNPATGDVVGEVPVTPVGSISTLVNQAHAAGEGWRQLSLEERAALLKKAGNLLERDAERLGELLSKEMGKPLRFGQGEVEYCGWYIPGKVDEIVDALQPVSFEDEGTSSTLYFDPFGVAGVISPWNFPMSMMQWMVLPSLMAGNTVIVKPSEETPLIAQAYVDVLNQFLPEHVLQIIHGTAEQGQTLVTSDIGFIAFTGSLAVGKHILRSSADDLKRVVLELGGKDPFIVMADADIEAAADFAVENSFENAGQMCVSTERIYVAEEIAEAFETRVAELAANISIGQWDDPKADMGPMINKRQRDHVIGQINDALSNGAKALVGGGNHPDRYVQPTVLVDVTDDMDIMREETFGPVACISRFSDVNDAIRRANDNPYGLGAVVFGGDEKAAYDVARQVDAGMVGVNKSSFGADGFPWIGVKQSGYGFHGSTEGHRQFTQRRVISKNK